MFYTSPNATYIIEHELESRVTEFREGAPVWNDYNVFNIFLDGKLVSFCHQEEDIASQVNFFENGDGIDPIYFSGITNG